MDVPAVLLEELQAARAAGADFDQAWAWATLHALGAAHALEQREWREALLHTRPDWQAAFLNQPPSAAAAAAGAAIAA